MDIKKINKVCFNGLIVIVIIIGLIILWVVYPRDLQVKISTKPHPLNPPDRIPFCKAGQTVKCQSKDGDLTASFKCLGSMQGISGRNRTILLENKDVLIYRWRQHHLFSPIHDEYNEIVAAVYYNQIPHRIDLLSINVERGKLLEEGYNYDYIMLPDNKYLIRPDVIFDGDSKKFSVVSENRMKLYEEFINTRKYPFREKIVEGKRTCNDITKFIGTLNHKYNLFAGNCHYGRCDDIWLEDPVSFRRSKYAKLNNKTSFMFPLMLSEKRIYLITPYGIEIFNSETGEVKDLLDYRFTENRTDAVILNNNNLFIMDRVKNICIIFDTSKNEIIFSKKLSIDKYYRSIAVLKEGNVLIYGSKINLFDYKKNIIISFKDDIMKRNAPGTLTVLKDGSILITGGSVPNPIFDKSYTLDCTTAELLTIEENMNK